MSPKKFYSERVGKNPLGGNLDLPGLKRLYMTFFKQFETKGYFQEAFGYFCVDADQVAGNLGDDINAAMMIALFKGDLWPIHERIENYTEEDLFDIIEFMHEHISEPTGGRYHDWNQCGHHYTHFKKSTGRAEYRDKLNPILDRYADGFELNDNGEIMTLPPNGIAPLLTEELPHPDKENVTSRVDAAIAKFRPGKATPHERKEAVRELVDVFEFLKKSKPDVFDKADESDLFHIANKFGIRHHDLDQKKKYDTDIFYNWIFYYYLASIHAYVRLITRSEEL